MLKALKKEGEVKEKTKEIMLRKYLSYAIIYLFMSVLIVFFLSPFTWLVLSAFDPKASPNFRIPETYTIKWFVMLFEPISAYFRVRPIDWIINSIIISTSVATLVTLLSVMSAYPLTRFQFKGQKAILNIFVTLRLLPLVVVVIPIVLIFVKIGLMNTYLGLILVMTTMTLPFGLLIAEGYFRALPKEYEEAAMVDGLSRWEAFLYITLRLALPGITTIWLLSFVTAWGEFLLPLVILRRPSLYPASVGIYYWFGVYGRVEYGRISAFSIVYSIPVILVFLFTRRYLTRGVAGLVTR